MLRSGHRIVGAHGGSVLDLLTPAAPPGWEGRSFVHPCFAAMRLRHFAIRRWSFRKSTASGRSLDVGEAISLRNGRPVGLIDPTSTVGPGALGTVFGNIVYHNFYGTRFLGPGDEIDGISGDRAALVWAESIQRYLQSDNPS